MKKRSIALTAAAIVIAARLAVAQTTMDGMDHSNMDHFGMKVDMGAMGSMDHTMLLVGLVSKQQQRLQGKSAVRPKRFLSPFVQARFPA